jgi:hypothetical protein
MLVKGEKPNERSGQPMQSDERNPRRDSVSEPDEDEMIFVRRREQRREEQRKAAAGAVEAGVQAADNAPRAKQAAPSRSISASEDALPHTARKSDTARMNAVHGSRPTNRDNLNIERGRDTTPTQRISAVKIKDDEDFIPDEYGAIRERTELTPEGKKRYVRTVVIASPIIAVCAVLLFLSFGIFVTALSVICAVVFTIFIAEIIAGCLLTLFSLIFGIVQLFSEIPIGIYEIGLSFIIAGVALALSVLTYKLSTGVLPYIIKHVCINLKNTLNRLSESSDEYKRRCNDE